MTFMMACCSTQESKGKGSKVCNPAFVNTAGNHYLRQRNWGRQFYPSFTVVSVCTSFMIFLLVSYSRSRVIFPSVSFCWFVMAMTQSTIKTRVIIFYWSFPESFSLPPTLAFPICTWDQSILVILFLAFWHCPVICQHSYPIQMFLEEK